MRAKDFIPASKPRNFVAKNSKTAGAGAHKDKKRAVKQGDVKHKKPYDHGVAEGWKDKVAAAGLAGAMALGGAGAHAQASGEDYLPDIVANVKFRVNGKDVVKDINLGTAYKSPREAGQALEKFMKSKGIRYYEYDLQRVKPKDDDFLATTPYTPANNTTNDYMDKKPFTDQGAKGDYMSK